MTPSEKMRWFWVTGKLPGSIFDDVDDCMSKGAGPITPPHRVRTSPQTAREYGHSESCTTTR
jgi:hypothetical protein